LLPRGDPTIDLPSALFSDTTSQTSPDFVTRADSFFMDSFC
jgi:hypothetical protein